MPEEPAPNEKRPPLLSLSAARIIVLRALALGTAGSLGALAYSALAGWQLTGASLVGPYWATIVVPLSLIELWLGRREPGWRTWLLGVVLLVSASFVITFLGGLQYVYARGVLEGGAPESGFARVRWALRTMEPADLLLLVAITTPIIVAMIVRLSRGLGRQLLLASASAGLISTPLILTSSQLAPDRRPYMVFLVFLVAAALPGACTLAERLDARWRED